MIMTSYIDFTKLRYNFQ